MKIHVVTGRHGDDVELIGVYSSKASAVAAADAWERKYRGEFGEWATFGTEIEETDLQD